MKANLDRIVHVFGRLNYAGAETLVMNLYRNINREKVQFDFVVHTEEKMDYEDEIYSLGGKIYRAPRFNGINIIQYIKWWNEFFRNHIEYKIIHGHLRGSAVFYLYEAKRNGLITIMHSHSISNGYGMTAIAKNILKYPLRFLSDYCLACSYPAGKWLFGKKKVHSDKFFLFKNAIDLDTYKFDIAKRNEMRKQLNVIDKIVIGHVGRFDDVKNHKFILRILDELKKIESDIYLLLVGNGPLYDEINCIVKKMDLNDKVIFVGKKKNVCDYLQAMDLFLFPSLYEGLGISIVEAQVSGLKVVCSKGIPTEVDFSDNVKYLDLNESIKNWVDTILKCNENYIRKSYIFEAQMAGYDIKQCTRWIENFYQELIQQKERHKNVFSSIR